MKRLLLIILLVFIDSIVFAEITYPDYYYVIDRETNFRIVLGGTPEFVSKYYGRPVVKQLLLKATSPDYEIWREIFEIGLTIDYETYDFMISNITIKTQRFITSKGIKIGSSESEVIEKYGEPTKKIKSKEKDSIIFIYRQELKEINLEGEYSLINFTIHDNNITSITLAIVGGA